MDQHAMKPFGDALLAWHEGNAEAELIIRRDDGHEVPLPVGYFFREPSDFTPLEQAALERCAGRVLDVGAGGGLHSLVLQQKGLHVAAIDIAPQAARIMKQRGVQDVHCTDFFAYRGGPFDTILILGHGIGMVETLAGLDRFLAHAGELLGDGGQMLVNSLDVRVTDDPANLAYHEAARQAGRYIGETRLQNEFGGTKGPYYGWLHVDPETLQRHAAGARWALALLHQEARGDYLARLTRQK